MSTDERLHSDAAQLEALLEGRASESDPAVRAVFERRPAWREVFEHARSTPATGAPWSGAESEADRRLVAECLAQAREPAPRPAPARPAQRPWTTLLALAAATLVVAWLARMTSVDEQAPVRPPLALLEVSGRPGFFERGSASRGYSGFEWTSKGLLPGQERFVLTVWALDPSGARGEQLWRTETQAESCRVPDEERATWPERVIWRVACFDKSDVPNATHEWFAQRSGP
jgi:hypothetical protein